ncbi:hypothetical protein OCU04_003049 [Sclerotinia nivalis]|uniref:Uncharacterized protein n=1 Tax=Sclerotinia nivalis TaxID=352851 RepID=A0A9X0AUX1_9HELO|nr:hypothetical protein OCU04_003049 [Sclerotinia nivalis]
MLYPIHIPLNLTKGRMFYGNRVPLHAYNTTFSLRLTNYPAWASVPSTQTAIQFELPGFKKKFSDLFAEDIFLSNDYARYHHPHIFLTFFKVKLCLIPLRRKSVSQ